MLLTEMILKSSDFNFNNFSSRRKNEKKNYAECYFLVKRNVQKISLPTQPEDLANIHMKLYM